MKPVTSALHDWMKTLFLHPAFKNTTFVHCDNSNLYFHNFTIHKTLVPDWKSGGCKNVLQITLYNTYSKYVNVSVCFETPDILSGVYILENMNFENLKLKDIIAFMEMYNKNYNSKHGWGSDPYGSYYVNPQNYRDRGVKNITEEYMTKNPEEVGYVMNMINTCFDFLKKRETLNIRIKAKESDFK